jgi:hypothetical protein
MTARAKEQLRSIVEDLRTCEWEPSTDLVTLTSALELVVDADAKNGPRWLSLTTALDRVEESQTLETFRRALTDNQLTYGWELLTTHPLDSLTHIRNTGTLDSKIRIGLELIRCGDDRAVLARTAKMLEDPTFNGAWRLARMQQRFIPVIRELVATNPQALAPIVRGPANARARWALALLFVAYSDSDPHVIVRRNTVPFELRDSDQMQTAWMEAARIDPVAVERLRSNSGINDTNERDFALLRAERKLAPLRCPRVWLDAVR